MTRYDKKVGIGSYPHSGSFKDKEGAFYLGPKVFVSDPCYAKDTWCTITVDTVLPGWYVCDVIKKNSDGWGNRIWELHAEFAKADLTTTGSEAEAIANMAVYKLEDELCRCISELIWEKVSGSVGVDSGQAGIFDFFQYPEGGADDKEFYDRCGEKTLGSYGYGVVPFGCVSSSGLGDGSYRLYVKRYKGQVVAFKVVFLSDDEDEDDEDDD